MDIPFSELSVYGPKAEPFLKLTAIAGRNSGDELGKNIALPENPAGVVVPGMLSDEAGRVVVGPTGKTTLQDTAARTMRSAQEIAARLSDLKGTEALDADARAGSGQGFKGNLKPVEPDREVRQDPAFGSLQARENPTPRDSKLKRILRRVPFLTTLILVTLNVSVFAAEIFIPGAHQWQWIRDWSLSPIQFITSFNSGNPAVMAREVATMFTAMFLHANFSHLFGNMFGLALSGIVTEKVLGAGRVLRYYLISGLMGWAALFAASWGSPIASAPTLGASGAIFGLMGATLAIGWFRFWRPVAADFKMDGHLAISAGLLAGIMGFSELVPAVREFHGVFDGVAHSAHAGAFIAGVVLVALWHWRQRRKLSTAGSADKPRT